MSHKESLQIYQRATPGPRHFDRLNENQQTRQQWEVAALLTNGLGVAVKSLRVSFLAVENISLFFEAFSLTVEEKPKKKKVKLEEALCQDQGESWFSTEQKTISAINEPANCSPSNNKMPRKWLRNDKYNLTRFL